MSAALAQFHFLRPLALLLLLAAPLFWLAWRHGRADAGAWRGAVDPHLLPHLIERVDGGPGRAGIVLATVLWSLACLALAGPAWEREPMPLYRNQAARVLALELAPTMLAQDEKPSRLARARYKLMDILSRSRDYQTALLGYSGDAFVAAPLTDDVGTVRNLVEALDPGTMPVPGNDTARAIRSAAALIDQAGLHHGTIILLADSANAEAQAAAREVHARGLRVSVLGVGSAAGAPVPLAQGDFLKDDSGNVIVSRMDEGALRALAEAGGGRYAHLTPDASDLDTLLDDHVEGVSRGNADFSGENAESARWRDRGPWLLLLLAPLALLGFRRGWLMAVAFALLAPLPSARAASFSDLWRRPDQQAADALARGDAKAAAETARSPDWRAGAAYRAGDYKTAEADYAKVGGADGAYNRGNALAKLGRYEDALAAYDEALKLAPGMADAQANRDAVEEFLKQQKQQDSQQQQQRSGKDSSQQKNPRDQPSPSGQDPQKQDPQGKDDKQDGEDGSKNQSQQGDPQDESRKSDSAGQEKQQEPSSKDAAQQDQNGAGSGEQDQAGQAKTQEPDAEQKKALSQSIDQALADGEKKDAGKEDKPRAGVAPVDEATREKQQALDHMLERVPDDPGGLLRRKFQLEYQRRQQRGGEGQ